ncbi:GumC family protein [Phaeovulum vinaykumarii]|uniref:non-specific protein-tyrosine kinase n=1 Tax=Phaeovulum vinaykumarii TaxID=407234 RepID=A0A1N7JI99_9RHOB|nr:polysaccharide biosynthesis tyrosine autokinase [Phaeovulum vinaykumarii]SIS49055.1 capsular exopolysaccharide family [Phaeovulum vinaykumarii]SOB89387.1 capsular exopolysaccharide synthesis family protein [Phaeovulum vinaykumarii]
MTQNASPLLSGPSVPSEDTIDVLAMLSSLRAGWRIIALTLAVAVLGGLIYIYALATPVYRATAVGMLETRQENVVDFESVISGLSGDSSEINTELEVLRSRGLMGRVVDELDLTADPEFNAELRPVSMIDTFKGATIGALKRLLGRAPPEGIDRTRDNVITAVLQNAQVGSVPSSYVFQVTFESEDPLKAARIADTIIELYVQSQIEVKFEATEQATSWLTTRVSELKSELEAAEAKVKAFNARTQLISAETLAAREVQLKEIRDRIDAARDLAAVLRAKADRLAAAQSLAQKIAAADDPRLAALAVDGTDAGSAFARRYDQLLARARTDAERQSAQVAALETRADELQAETARDGNDLIALEQLEREAEANRLLYEYFLSRLKETTAQKGFQQADSRILSHAVVPEVASEPRKGLVLALMTVLGLMGGAAIVLVREALFTGFRTAAALEAHAGATVLGQIPLLPVNARGDLPGYLTARPAPPMAESVNNLRTSILLSNLDNPPKVILYTSALMGEGKTTNSVAMTHNLARLGKKVLLIEGDIRRCVLSQYLATQAPGTLVKVLAREMDFDAAVARDPQLGADVLVGEQPDINPADFFASEAFAGFVAAMRERYDFVIIDAPPVLMAPDARIIARVADAVLLVVRWEKTTRHQLDEALALFRAVNLPLTGLVLSQIDMSAQRRYGGYGTYGAYEAYGPTS